MFFRDKIINTNTLLAMAAQRSERVQERIVSLLINITIYYMCLCKQKICIYTIVKYASTEYAMIGTGK